MQFSVSQEWKRLSLLHVGIYLVYNYKKVGSRYGHHYKMQFGKQEPGKMEVKDGSQLQITGKVKKSLKEYDFR